MRVWKLEAGCPHPARPLAPAAVTAVCHTATGLHHDLHRQPPAAVGGQFSAGYPHRIVDQVGSARRLVGGALFAHAGSPASVHRARAGSQTARNPDEDMEVGFFPPHRGGRSGRPAGLAGGLFWITSCAQFPPIGRSGNMCSKTRCGKGSASSRPIGRIRAPCMTWMLVLRGGAPGLHPINHATGRFSDLATWGHRAAVRSARIARQRATSASRCARFASAILARSSRL